MFIFVSGMAASQMGQGMGSYYSPAAAYGSLSAASMAAAAAAAQQTAMSAGLSTPAQVKSNNFSRTSLYPALTVVPS